MHNARHNGWAHDAKPYPKLYYSPPAHAQWSLFRFRSLFYVYRLSCSLIKREIPPPWLRCVVGVGQLKRNRTTADLYLTAANKSTWIRFTACDTDHFDCDSTSVAGTREMLHVNRWSDDRFRLLFSAVFADSVCVCVSCDDWYFELYLCSKWWIRARKRSILWKKSLH